MKVAWSCLIACLMCIGTLHADHIYFVNNKGDADLVVYVVDNQQDADFRIWITDSPIYATKFQCWYIEHVWISNWELKSNYKRVYVTKFKNDAQLKIYYVHHMWEAR